MIQKAIHELVESKSLDFETAREVMDEITSGNATQAQTSSFLTALRMKGETIDGIVARATVMRNKAVKLPPPFPIMDIVGAGGDEVGIFNISTTDVFVAAAGGIWVVGHGNRSISNKSGTAGVLERLGAELALIAQQAETVLENTRTCFLSTPVYHFSMKYAAPVRREARIRSIFNTLDLLFSPIGASMQLLGVYSRGLAESLAQVLANLGVTRGMVVCGGDGLGETIFTSPTHVYEIRYGKIMTYNTTPEGLGLAVCSLEGLIGDTPEENAKMTRNILSGSLKGPKRDMVILSAAVSLYLGIDDCTVRDCIKTAQDIIDSRATMAKMKKFIQAMKKTAEEVKAL